MTEPARRVRARVEGTVQGVGFRPFVHRLAGELGLSGWVLNDEHGVLLEAEGGAGAVGELLARIRSDPPAIAAVERLSADELRPLGGSGFEIRASRSGGGADAAIAPDAATCSDCLRELFDPADRRHRYPFINCTNCGPRFTIVRGVPYDRPLTTMAAFAMCERCRAEYDDPGDRRFHAQPNACPDCGPRARLLNRDGTDLAEADPVAAAGAAIAAGLIVAVKGLGGFHLACSATDPAAVASLRERKHREDRPFALMVADEAAAAALADLGDAERRLLAGPERPIVVARRRPGAEIADAVAPASADLGVMLAYTPLHQLLLAECDGPLVMTSGNVSDEPIAFEDSDALTRLGAIADRFLTHDRPIHIRTDDSVARATGSGPLLIRRSRGYVPRSIGIPVAAVCDVLAVGAEQKNTFCLVKGGRAWVGHHIGDLENWETLRSFRDGIGHFARAFGVSPAVVAHDLHPEYLSTKHALELEGVELVAVQHHHAHLAAVLAEHGETAPAVGAIFDGTGFGGDGSVWGGELLIGDLAGFERAGMILPVRLPGGAAAVREPWRMACAWLAAALGEECPAVPVGLRDVIVAERWEQVAELARTGVASPVTTSAGRLFDAVAAICGLRAEVSYEGQAAIELEACAEPGERGAYAWALTAGEPLVLDPRPALRELTADLGRGVGAAVASARFHNGFADAAAEGLAAAARARAIETAVLAGGVFQNRLALERTTAAAVTAGLRVLRAERLPPNDGAISYGQAAVAAATTRA